jgi:hypothetical protein
MHFDTASWRLAHTESLSKDGHRIACLIFTNADLEWEYSGFAEFGGERG